MEQTTLQTVWEEAKTLPVEDRERLREMLSEDLTGKRQRTEEEILRELDERLLAKGIISRIPPPITDPESFRRYQPIKVKGKPISETLIEDRR